MTLLKQQMKNEGLSLAIWAIALGLIGFIMIYMWGAMAEKGSMGELDALMKAMPEGIRGFIGGGATLTTLTGWLQAYGFGSWNWVFYLIYTAMFVTGIVTREMDRHTIDFLLGLPVSRRHVLLSRYAALVLSLIILHVAHFGGIALGILAIGEELALGTFLLLLLNSMLLFLAMGGILLVLTLFIDDYGRGVGATLGIGIGLVFYYFSAEGSTGLLKELRTLLPFAFYEPGKILTGNGVPWSNLSVLAGVAVVSLGLAVYLFDRKQIAA